MVVSLCSGAQVPRIRAVIVVHGPVAVIQAVVWLDGEAQA